MKTPIFRGAATALITPFDPRGQVDYDALERLIDRQLALGCGGLVLCATTGEGATLSDREYADVLSCACARVNGRVPLLAGAGSNDTRAALLRCREAARIGCDGLLLVTPYYNKATQSGLVEHFTALADASPLPVLLYNVPSRTGVTIAPETYARLARHPAIYGVKEAGGDLSAIVKTRALCPADFALYSGNDDHTLALLALGGCGVISTVGNLVPREMSDLCTRWDNGDRAGACALQLLLQPLIEAVFRAVNPVPLKAAMAMLGLCGERLRLPLTRLDAPERPALTRALQDAGLLS